MTDKRNGNLGIREVAIVSPEVLVIFVKFLRVVARDDDNGVVSLFRRVDSVKDMRKELVNLKARVTVEIPEGRWVGVVVEVCVFGVEP